MQKVKKFFHDRLFIAGFWSISGHGMSQLLRLGSNLIMTRLLIPEMFGIMAIANILIVGLNLFSDLGLRQNIIRSKRGDDPLFLNTVWSIQIIRGFFIWALALLVSFIFYLLGENGWFTGDTVYSDPVLPFVIAVISVSAVIAGFQSTNLATAVRQFSQKRIALLEIYSQLFGFMIMLAWVLIDRSIWALVIGGLASSMMRVVLTHTMLPGISNRLEWDSPALKEIFHFGKWIFLSSIISFLFNNGDRLLLSGMVSAEILGIYSIAFMMLNVLQQAVSKFIGAVVFPSLCEAFHEQNNRLIVIYHKFRFWLDSLLFLLVGILIMLGPLLIDALYDERYSDAGSMLQILSLLLIMSRYAITYRFFLAIGKPKLMTLLNMVQLVALYCFVPLGFYFYDFEGALWAIVLSYYINIPVLFHLMMKNRIFNIQKELITLPMLFIGIGLGALVLLMVR